MARDARNLVHAPRDHDDAVEHRIDAIDVSSVDFFDAESAPADVYVNVVREERVQDVQARFERLGLLRLRDSGDKQGLEPLERVPARGRVERRGDGVAAGARPVSPSTRRADSSRGPNGLKLGRAISRWYIGSTTHKFTTEKYKIVARYATGRYRSRYASISFSVTSASATFSVISVDVIFDEASVSMSS